MVALVLTIFVFSNWSHLSSLQKQYGDISAGPGLYLYTVGVVSIWICAMRIWLAGLTHSRSSSPQVVLTSSSGATTRAGASGQSSPPATATAVSRPPADPGPGWYTDPRGLTRVRYWDGSAWTEHTQA